MNKTVKIFFIGLSISLFMFSLFKNCYLVDNNETVGSFGLVAFLLGIFNASQSFVVWFANPLYSFSLILFFLNNKKSIVFSFLALLLGLSFLFLNKVIINEGGTQGQVMEYLSGYWLWISSMAVLFIGSLLFFLDQNTENVSKNN